MTSTQFFFNLVLNGLVEGLVISMCALSLTLVYAVLRFPNAATGDYMTLGAYAAKGVQHFTGAPMLISGAAGILATIAVAVFFHLWVFRKLAGRTLAAPLVASIGVAYFVRSVLTFFVGHEHLVYDIPLVRAMNWHGLRVQATDLWVAAAALLSLAACFGILYLTRIGRQMRAVADNPDLARASGIRSGRVTLVMWVLAGAVAALGGILLGVKSILHAELGWDFMVAGFTAMILGGVGNPVGAVVGGIAIGLVQELSAPIVGYSYKIAVAFTIMVLMLLWRPHGLFGYREGTR
ncbi:MAG: branched-chain amino acid ABC transporter permease [Rhodobiaceae bacterium]|nr:branched-chain amino acid ABC transporter permease [Rhodobiaceae bacterium]